MCERISLLWSYQFRGGKLCSAELFFATSSFASSHAELFRPIRSAQAVQNCRKFKYVIVQAGRAALLRADFNSSRKCRFHFISSKPLKHYYCIATASQIQAVQSGRSSTTIADRSSRPCRFHFKQAVQHYYCVATASHIQAVAGANAGLCLNWTRKRRHLCRAESSGS